MKFKFRKILILFILLFSIFVISCNKNKNGVAEKLIIYTTNDFHGAIEEENGKYGAARMSSFIKNSIEENSDAASVVISSGDMFQGSAISNYTRGEIVIDIMNEIKFDAMTIGNHEFDWGLSTVLNYCDGEKSNGEANFPFLGCNIIEKSTSTLPENVKAYQIVEEKGLKIGIIGYMGQGLESSIATTMIENYYFSDPIAAIKKYSLELRTEKDCDIVIVSGHDGSTLINKQISKLSGDERIDAIVNGHTHATYTETYKRDDGVVIPVIQTGTAGENVGVMTLSIDKETKTVTSGSAYNYQLGKKVTPDIAVQKLVDDIVLETAPIFKRVLCTAGSDINQIKCAQWATDALYEYMDSDIAFSNAGGIRNSAFPIVANQEITVAKVFEIMPFDNTIKTCYLKGNYVKAVYFSSEIITSGNVTIDSMMNLYIDGELLDENKMYKVCTNDYVFDHTSYPFGYGEDSIATGILFRDILIENLENINNNGQQWLE